MRHYDGYSFDAKETLRELHRVMKSGAVCIWVVGDKTINGSKSLTSFRHAFFAEEAGFNIHDVMIYQKKNTAFMRKNGYTNCFEWMFVFSKGKPKTFNPLMEKTARHGPDRAQFNKGADGMNTYRKMELKKEKVRTNIWQYAVGGGSADKIAFEHPAIFPEKLAEDHVLSWSNSGDIVFDPMCGSGTTCKMAAIHDRHYIGIDVSAEYADLAKRRIANIDE